MNQDMAKSATVHIVDDDVSSVKLIAKVVVRAVPEKTGAYEKLHWAARHLAETRLSNVNRQATEFLIAEFEAAVGSSWNERFPGVGALLVAAVADEKAGVQNAVESLESWLTDPDRFSETWAEAVRDTIQKAHTHIN